MLIPEEDGMSGTPTEPTDHIPIDDGYHEEGSPEDGDDIKQRERYAWLAGWGISLALHAVVSLILVFIVVTVRLTQAVPPTRAVDIETIMQPPEEEPPQRELERVDVTVEHEVEAPNPTVRQPQRR